MRMQAELERYKADLFQSTPGLTVGRCVQAGHRQFDVGQFQSTPGLTVGRCPCRRSASRIRYCFNPRPASRSGDAGNKLHVFRFRRVSIHARPHGRAMRGEHRYKERKLYGFNPRPASRSGDAPDLPPEGHPLRVSIHARPHGRAMHQAGERDVGAAVVSIHARPHGRAMPHPARY